MSKEKILNRYKDIVLGDNYKNEKLFVNDVETEERLISTMYDFLSREVDLYKEGIEFLKEYWGLENVARIIFDYENDTNGDFHQAFHTEKGLYDWLYDMLKKNN